MTRPTFGDHVRIAVTPETTAAGVAGLEGSVYGFTTPSVTGVNVIGRVGEDYALAVVIESRGGETFWLEEALVELIDHAPGTEIWAAGSPFKSVRNPDGSWRREARDSARKPWWRFW
jgi:hypothetical protein